MSVRSDLLASLPPFARVVVRSPNGTALAALLATCWERQLVAVPLHPATSDADRDAIAAEVAASALIDGDPATPPRPLPGDPDHPDAKGLAFIIYTSGSTGRPKGVMLDREAVAGNAAATAALHRFGPDRPHGTCLPFFHVNALVMSLMGTHLTGAPLVFGPASDPAGYFAALDRGGARTASVVPAILRDIVDARPPWPERLDYLVTAAAPLSSDLARRFHQLYGPRLRQGYGLSEAMNFSFVMPTLDSAEFTEHYIDQHPPVGLPLEGTRLRLEDGEVWIASPDLTRGYWQNPEATRELLPGDGWLRTGDLGELRDGYLVLRGRVREVINRGGEKYHPLDVERRWRAAGAGSAFAAVAVAEPGLGHETGIVTADEDLAQVRTLYDTAVPRPVVAQLGGLLLTSTGKPRRAAMGARLAARRDNARRYADLLDYASLAARALVDGGVPPRTAQAACLHRGALALATQHPVDAAPQTAPRTAAHDAIDALVDYWPELADGGGNGVELMRRHRGLWKRLMTEWPMVVYAEHITDVLKAGDLLRGRVLEAGSGVGNTTSRIAPLVDGEFVWSDVVPDLVARGGWPGRGTVLDLDTDPPPGLGRFDTVLATNAVHCVADKPATLRRLHSLLAPGGRLVLSEGSSPTTPGGMPWALDYLFALWDGWWDRGGFRSRWEWLDLLAAAGFRDLGYSAVRAGRHDLGGVVWGTKR